MKQLILVFTLFGILNASAQEKMTQAEYQQAIDYTYGNLMNKKVFNLKTEVHPFEDGSGICFLNYDKAGKSYLSLNYKDSKVTPLFDHTQLAEALSTELDEDVEAADLDLSKIERKDGKLYFVFNEKPFYWDVSSAILKTVDSQKNTGRNSWRNRDRSTSTSPDGKWKAFVEDHNLVIEDTKSGNRVQLTTDGEPGYDYASSIGWFDILEGEGTERPPHFYVQWSPDSKDASPRSDEPRRSNFQSVLLRCRYVQPNAGKRLHGP